MRERRFHTGNVEGNYAEGPPNGPPFVILFADFDAFWTSHLGSALSIQRFVDALDDQQRATLIDLTRAGLRANSDGSIAIPIRAWAFRAYQPG